MNWQMFHIDFVVVEGDIFLPGSAGQEDASLQTTLTLYFFIQ